MAQATRATSGLSTPRSRTGRRAPRRLPVRLLRALNDERLVALLRRGHPEAFEALFDRYQAPLLSFCRHMLGSRADGEDATQQAFMSAYSHLVDSTRPIHLRPWLYTIARNQCLTQLRARRETASLDAVVDDQPDTEGLAEQVQRSDDLRALLADLAALPEQQRAALVLSEVGDLSHRDVAAVLDCEPKQVKALVYQARSSLMADRKARETSCAEIREQLAVGRGHDLLRTELRRHLRTCDGCREFADEVKRQRRSLAVLLPVVPTAMLRHGTLSAALGSAAGGSVATGGVIGGAAGKGLAVKALAVALAAGGVGAGVAVTRTAGHHSHQLRHARPASSHAHSTSAPTVAPHTPAHRRATVHTHAAPTVAPPPAHAQPPAAASSPVPGTPAHTVVPPGHAHQNVPAQHAYGRVRGHKQHVAPVLRHAPAKHSPTGHKRARVHRQPHAGTKKPPPSTAHGPKSANAGKSGGSAAAATASAG